MKDNRIKKISCIVAAALFLALGNQLIELDDTVVPQERITSAASEFHYPIAIRLKRVIWQSIQGIVVQR